METCGPGGPPIVSAGTARPRLWRRRGLGLWRRFWRGNRRTHRQRSITRTTPRVPYATHLVCSIAHGSGAVPASPTIPATAAEHATDCGLALIRNLSDKLPATNNRRGNVIPHPMLDEEPWARRQFLVIPCSFYAQSQERAGYALEIRWGQLFRLLLIASGRMGLSVFFPDLKE